MPRSFWDGIVRDDRRDWMQSTKKEMLGWVVNGVYEQALVSSLPPGTKVVRLGELFSIKRSDKAKHRLVIFGHLLSLSHDGLRLFCALAAAMHGLRIYGLDASCAYLQSKPMTAKKLVV